MSARYDDSGNLTPERRAEMAKAFGLDELPKPRYDDLPEVHDHESAGQRFNLMKAAQLVDPLATAAFERYIPDRLVIDQQMSAREFRQGWSWALYLDTSKPIPVNRKITAATGITAARTESNWYTWLAQHVAWAYDELGARAMAPPLIWRTGGKRRGRSYTLPPMLGVMCKFDRTVPEGMRADQMGAAIGLMHPSTQNAKNRVVIDAVASRGTLATKSMDTK